MRLDEITGGRVTYSAAIIVPVHSNGHDIGGCAFFIFAKGARDMVTELFSISASNQRIIRQLTRQFGMMTFRTMGAIAEDISDMDGVRQFIEAHKHRQFPPRAWDQFTKASEETLGEQGNGFTFVITA